LCPCVKTIMWDGTATLLHDNLFKRFGLPDKMISDRDPRFAAHTFQELLKLLNIKLNLTTAYHPVRWSNQKGKPRNRSIFVHLLHVTSRRLATFTQYSGIHAQQ
jgi:transposase InsO family protein